MGIIIDIFLPVALAFIMFSLGLGLTGADFTRVIKQPKDFFLGLIFFLVLHVFVQTFEYNVCI